MQERPEIIGKISKEIHSFKKSKINAIDNQIKMKYLVDTYYTKFYTTSELREKYYPCNTVKKACYITFGNPSSNF